MYSSCMCLCLTMKRHPAMCTLPVCVRVSQSKGILQCVQILYLSAMCLTMQRHPAMCTLPVRVCVSQCKGILQCAQFLYVFALCLTDCQFMTYGEDCAQSCGHCRGGQLCDPVTGHCPHGCQPGYTNSDQSSVVQLCQTRQYNTR